MKKYFKHSLIFCFLLLLTLALPMTTQAAKKPTAKKVKALYNKFMASYYSDSSWFCTLDINRDGVKELIASRPKTKSWDDDIYYIYRVKSNKVTYVGKISVSGSYGSLNKPKAVYYNRSLKAIRATTTTAVNLTHTLYQLSGGKLKERLTCSGTYGRYPFYYKSVKGGAPQYFSSAASYEKFSKKYMEKGCTKKKLVKNTARNRKKYL